MPFIKIFVVFVALGLSILIFAGSEGVVSLYLIFKLLCYLNFPPGLSNVIIPPSCCASILNFPLSLFFYISCCSSVTQLSSVFLFELPAAIITVIITLSLSMSAVSRASFNCRSSVSHLSESLPRTAYYFLFSFSSSWSMSEKHVWKSHWRLSPCRRLFQAESWVVSFKLMLILWSIDCPSILILFSDNILSCWCDQVFKLFSFCLIV